MKGLFFVLSFLLLILHNNAAAQVALEVNGQPFNDISRPETEGYPYLIKDWASGSVLLENKTINATLKFNIYNNQVLFQDKSGQELELKNKFIGFTLNSPGNELSNINPLVFVNGYPDIGSQTGNSLYQLIADGKVKLLKFYKKNISEDREYDSSVITSTYKTIRIYYVFKNNRLKEIQPNKKSILKLFDNHQADVDNYLNINKINFNSDSDLQKLFNWYNTLN